MNRTELILLIIGIILVVIAIIIMVVRSVMNKNRRVNRVDEVTIKDDIRYTKGKDIRTEFGGVKVTHLEGDILLERGITYEVAKNGLIIPGKYTVLSADGNVDKFNIRCGGLVREMRHSSDIVLSEGDKIAAVSHSVILR